MLVDDRLDPDKALELADQTENEEMVDKIVRRILTASCMAEQVFGGSRGANSTPGISGRGDRSIYRVHRSSS